MSKIDIILIIVLVIILLFTGGKKLPELARGVGEAASELKKGLSGEKDKEKSDKKEETKK